VTGPAFYAILFSGALGVSDAHMSPKLSYGPFPTERLCYAALALGIDHLNGSYPRVDFRGVCSISSALDQAHGRLFDLQMLAKLAGI
jgi:hypothetical protein